MSIFLDVNPELNKPEGSYFGISVFDGYDHHQCFSMAWEILHYWGTDSKGFTETAIDVFPGKHWEEEDKELMQQLIAINQGFAEMPEERFVCKTIIVDKGK